MFYAFNNFHIRHNNADPQSPKFKKPIGDLAKEQLEFWYDEVYQMCLLAILRLEHADRKKTFEALKSEIENKTPWACELAVSSRDALLGKKIAEKA